MAVPFTMIINILSPSVLATSSQSRVVQGRKGRREERTKMMQAPSRIGAPHSSERRSKKTIDSCRK